MYRFLLVIFLSICSVSGYSQSTFSRKELELINEFDKLNNKTFPTLELEDTEGNIFNTSTLKGKTIYVDFWFTQCPPCLAEIPYAKALQAFFASDTNVVFLNICIENKERKDAWKSMIKAKEIGGINLFYAKNQPQKVNLLREYKVVQFPTYMLVNNDFKIIGYNGAAPSERGWVQWSLTQAMNNISLSSSYKSYIKRSQEAVSYMKNNLPKIDSIYKAVVDNAIK